MPDGVAAMFQSPRHRRIGLITVFVFVLMYFGYIYHNDIQRIAQLPPSVAPGWNGRTGAKGHPIQQLFDGALQHHTKLLHQSKNYEDAVRNYRSRYESEPPPGFQDWLSFAQQHQSQIMDDFDLIREQIKPFKGRLANSQDLKNVSLTTLKEKKLLRLCFSNGRADLSEGHMTLQSMVESFAQYMPEMCVLINNLDEPRIILPHDTIELLEKTPSSPGLPSLNFLDMSHQNVWQETVLSCAPNSPARLFGAKETSTSSSSPLSFVKDFAASSDLCNFAEMANVGLSVSPTTFSITHDAYPVLSNGVLSTFQDILFPSLWRFENDNVYVEGDDVPWEEKKSQIYWRGSTTGGYSRNGNWRHFQRQVLVDAMRSDVDVKTYKTQSGKYQPSTAKMTDFHDKFDVSFTAMIQCDGPDCNEQKAHFREDAREPLKMAWHNKIVLDIDGNGISGRLYGLLRSTSAVMRQSIFREWHDERLVPWLHYIPLSMDMSELAEITRFLLEDDAGMNIMKLIADAGREWSKKVLRKEDMQIYMFRLLLEMARA
jgi:hypothetical protein